MSSIGATSRSPGPADEQPDTRRVRIEVVDLGEFKVKRQTTRPRRSASADTSPPSRSAARVCRVVSGHVHVALEGGEELDVRPGDVFVISPGLGDPATDEERRLAA